MADKTLRERIAEKMGDIKLLLKLGDETPAATKAAADTPAENTATLKDGTELRWTGELANGTEVKVVTAAGVESPKDGNIELMDGTVLTVAGGKITNVTEAVAPEQGVEFATHEEVKAVIAAFDAGAPDVAKIASVLKFMFNEQFGWMLKEKERQAQMETIVATVQTFEAHKKENETQITDLKKAVALSAEMIEEIGAEPGVKTQKPINAQFSKVKEIESASEKFRASLAKINSTQK